ncbi:MAG: pH regulation protein F [Nitriliruptor sp.]|nr:MAG: pH regulation protein F [Nitriliruptor sp.]TVR28531.1 MAG: pH regulation protein F [Nitriliruptor sp.]
MDPFLIGATIAVAVLIGAGLHRVWAGPTVFDRLVAVALVTANGVVIIVLLGAVLERPNLFFDIGISYALLAFLLPLALGRYFEQQQMHEPDQRGADDTTSAQEHPDADGDATAAGEGSP